MRLEQKSFAEKYIEKIVLLVALLVAGWIVMTFVVGDPYSVEMNGNVQSPQKIEEDIRAKAKVLQGKVTSDQVAKEINGFAVPDYVTRFWDRHAEKLVSSDTIPIALGPKGPGYGDIIGGVDGGLDVQPVLPPAAFALVVRDSFHVVESSEYVRAQLLDVVSTQYPNAKTKEIEDYVTKIIGQIDGMVSDEAPRDVRQSLIRATIDLEKYKQALLAVDEELRMPENWWEQYSNFLADVVVERQTLDPTTGKWGDAVEIKPIPGSIVYDIRQQVEDLEKFPTETEEQSTAKVQVTTSLFEKMRFYVSDIARPQTLPYKSHTPLYTSADIPTSIELSKEDQVKLYEVRQKIDKLESDLRRLTGSTNLSPGRVAPGSGFEGQYGPESGIPGTGRPGTGRQPPKPRPGTGSTDGKRPNAAAARAALQQERIKQLQERLSKLYDAQAIILKQNEGDPKDPTKTGGPNNGNRLDPRLDPRFQNPRQFNPGFEGRLDPRGVRGQRPNKGGRFGDDPGEEGVLPKIDVWGHDLTIEHGKTYRYRVSYKLINPLYQKDVKPEEVKKANYSKLLITSEPSEWSEPVSIEQEMYLFVNKASAQSNSATFELYRIHNGRRVKHEFSVSPGDIVGGVTQSQVFEPETSGGPLVARTRNVNVQAPAVLVDVKQPPKAPGAIGNRGPITVILADTTTKKMYIRKLQDDLANSERKRLHNEAGDSVRTSIGLNR